MFINELKKGDVFELKAGVYTFNKVVNDVALCYDSDFHLTHIRADMKILKLIKDGNDKKSSDRTRQRPTKSKV